MNGGYCLASTVLCHVLGAHTECCVVSEVTRVLLMQVSSVSQCSGSNDEQLHRALPDGQSPPQGGACSLAHRRCLQAPQQERQGHGGIMCWPAAV